jgi:hypothetical protein
LSAPLTDDDEDGVIRKFIFCEKKNVKQRLSSKLDFALLEANCPREE